MIYLDYHATTPCDPGVVKAMQPYYSEIFGNPSSTGHRAGKDSAEAIEYARELVASLVNSHPKEIVFTSGATEANNLAIRGMVNGKSSKRRMIVTSSIEHKSVLGPCELLKREGYEVRILPVDRKGNVDLDAAERTISEHTLLVTIQAANNEIGTIQNLRELAKIAHRKGASFHTDAAQAVGKLPMDVNELEVDLLTFSAHKMCGPKGIGALYVKGGPYSAPLRPILVGGGQEYGLRSGTYNVPGIVGFGEACRISEASMGVETPRVGRLRDALEEGLAPLGAKVNGDTSHRLPGNSSLTFSGVDADALLVNMPDLALSTGAACTSSEFEPSHVLLAIGLDRGEATSTIRIGLGRFSSDDEIQITINTITSAIHQMREAQGI